MKQPADSNAECAIRQNTKTLLQDVWHLRHLNALIDTIKWMVKSIGQYAKVWGYRLLTSTMNIYLKGS